MSQTRCSYCGETCEHPMRLNFAINGRQREIVPYATLYLCTRCSNSWCTDRSLQSAGREEWVGPLFDQVRRRRAG